MTICLQRCHHRSPCRQSGGIACAVLIPLPSRPCPQIRQSQFRGPRQMRFSFLRATARRSAWLRTSASLYRDDKSIEIPMQTWPANWNLQLEPKHGHNLLTGWLQQISWPETVQQVLRKLCCALNRPRCQQGKLRITWETINHSRWTRTSNPRPNTLTKFKDAATTTTTTTLTYGY